MSFKQYITTLEDVTPLVNEVNFRGKTILVNPLSLAQIGRLMRRHKTVRDIFAPKQGEERTVDFYDALIESGDEVVHDIVEVCTGILGAGARMNAIEQGNIIFTCLSSTLPDDKKEFSDFLAQVKVLAAKAQDVVGEVNQIPG